MRMEPKAPDFPGAKSHPEVIGQLDVDLEAGWPPVVALFIDVGNTAPELVGPMVEGVRDSLQGLFPPGRTLFVPQRGQSKGTTLYRLEEEPWDPGEGWMNVEALRAALGIPNVTSDVSSMTALQLLSRVRELGQQNVQLERANQELRKSKTVLEDALTDVETELDDLRSNPEHWRGSGC